MFLILERKVLFTYDGGCIMYQKPDFITVDNTVLTKIDDLVGEFVGKDKYDQNKASCTRKELRDIAFVIVY